MKTATSWSAGVRNKLVRGISIAKDPVFAFNRYVEYAMQVDDGSLRDSGGHPGYAWTPKFKRWRPSPKKVRRANVAASLGRLLAGYNVDYRVATAFHRAATDVRIERRTDMSQPKVQTSSDQQSDGRLRLPLLRDIYKAIDSVDPNSKVNAGDRSFMSNATKFPFVDVNTVSDEEYAEAIKQLVLKKLRQPT